MTLFWDTSALVPLLVAETTSARAEALLRNATRALVWWGTSVELRHALGRRLREGDLLPADLRAVEARLGVVLTEMETVAPSADLRTLAESLAFSGTLRSADALQLAAGLTIATDLSLDAFVTFDRRLAEAARARGLSVLTQDP